MGDLLPDRTKAPGRATGLVASLLGSQLRAEAGDRVARVFVRRLAGGGERPRFRRVPQCSAQRTRDMQGYLAEYLPILIFLAIAVGLSAVIVGASALVARQRPDP